MPDTQTDRPVGDIAAPAAPPSTIPEPANLSPVVLREVLALGWRDFRRAPLYGIVFSAVYVLGGLIMFAIFAASAARST